MEIPKAFWAFAGIGIILIATGFLVSQTSGLLAKSDVATKITGNIILRDNTAGTPLTAPISLPGNTCTVQITSCGAAFKIHSPQAASFITSENVIREGFVVDDLQLNGSTLFPVQLYSSAQYYCSYWKQIGGSMPAGTIVLPQGRGDASTMRYFEATSATSKAEAISAAQWQFLNKINGYLFHESTTPPTYPCGYLASIPAVTELPSDVPGATRLQFRLESVCGSTEADCRAGNNYTKDLNLYLISDGTNYTIGANPHSSSTPKTMDCQIVKRTLSGNILITTSNSTYASVSYECS